MSSPKFEKRKAGKEVQVRFHSDLSLYKEFVKEVKDNELLIKDVFIAFMKWFIKSKDKIIK